MDDLPVSTTNARLGAARYGSLLMARSHLLLVCGPSEDVLQEHANELLSWLRQQPTRLLLEPMLSLEGEQLIQRFNEMLADLSIQAAVRPDTPQPPGRLWVLRDGGQLQEQDVRLLARLQQQFPAARLSTIVLTTQAARFAGLLASEERGILGWVLPGASALPRTAPEPRVEPLFAASAAPAGTPVPQPVPARANAQTSTRPPQPLHRGVAKTFLGALLGFVTSTSLAVGALVWLHTNGQLEAVIQGLGLATDIPPRTEAVATPAAPPPEAATGAAPAPAEETSPTAGATTSPQTASDTAEPATDRPAARNTSASPGPAEATAANRALPAPPAKASETAEVRAAEVRASDGRAAAQADPRVQPPLPAALREGQRWVDSLPAENHLVVHGRFDSLTLAQQFARKHPYLQNARLLPGGPAQPGQVLVVTGPFQSEPRARAYITRLELRDAETIQAAQRAAPR